MPASNMHSSYSTGALVDPAKGLGSAFDGDGLLPRSVASDGRRWVLFLHVIVHAAALTFNILACINMWSDFEQLQIEVGATVATAMHGIGILTLLALAASEIKQVAFVVSNALITSFLLSGLLATCAMIIFTFRSDDKLTPPHWMYYASVYCQTLGLSMYAANVVNMAAHGDEAIDKGAEAAPLAPA